MKASVLQEVLKHGLATVNRAVAGKSTLPILSNILLRSEDDGILLAATNLEIGITCRIAAKVENHGAITIPAKLLIDIVNSLPNDHIDLDLNEQTQALRLTCGSFEMNIKGIEADEFPVIPTVNDQEAVAAFPARLLREIIEQVSFAAAKDYGQPVLCGVQVQLQDKTAIFAAADRYRLSVRTVDLPEAVARSVELIIPARALSELSRIIDDEQDVELTVTPSGGQILFHTENIDLTSRLIEGRFPDIHRIIPSSYITRTVVNTKDLLKAVKLASYFATKSADVVRLQLQTSIEDELSHLTISANAAEVGDNKGRLSVLMDGEGGQIALNVKYFAEGLDSINTPSVALEIQSERHPAVLKPIGIEDYIHIVMPMTIQEKMSL